MSTIREPVFHEQYREYVEKVDAFLADYYAHSEFCLIDVSLKATQAVAAFSNAEMTAADCADILCEEFVYKLKG